MVQLFLAVTLITVINTPKGPGSPSQDSNLDTIATFIQTPLVKAREQEQMAKHGGLVRLALSSDGHYAVTGSENGFVVVSRLSDKTKLRSTRIDEFSDAFFAGVCFDMHDVSFVYYVTLKGLYRWNWRKDELPDRVFGENSREFDQFTTRIVTQIVCSRDGTKLACIDMYQRVFLISLSAGKTMANPTFSMIQDTQTRGILLPYKSGSVAFSPNSSFLAFTTNTFVSVLNLKQNRVVSTLKGHEDVVSSVVFLSDKEILTGTWDGCCRTWDTSNGKSRLVPITSKMKEFALVSVSHDGKRFVCCVGEGHIEAFEFPSLNKIARFNGPTSGFTGVFFLNDPNLFVTSGEDERLQFWDIEKSKGNR